jgi:hypothetical protein
MTPRAHRKADHRAELIDAALHLLARQLPSEPIAYIWPERHRVLFCTADGRTGDVEVLVNFEVLPADSGTDGADAR